MKKSLKGFIKKYKEEFYADSQKRRLIYEKLDELNRISFSFVYKRLCDKSSIDLGDLWPITERGEGISLSSIRNKLVHGDPIGPEKLKALIAAKTHLRWILERIILSILGWPIERSRVSKEYIYNHMNFGKGWDKYREIISS